MAHLMSLNYKLFVFFLCSFVGQYSFSVKDFVENPIFVENHIYEASLSSTKSTRARRIRSISRGKSQQRSFEGIKHTKLTSMSDQEAFLKFIGSLALPGKRHLIPEVDGFAETFFNRSIDASQGYGPRCLEVAYALIGMVSGTGVTWNAFANFVLVNTFHIFDGGYSAYTRETPVSHWIVMIALNIHTYTVLYALHASQMYENAKHAMDNIRDSKPYLWPPSSEGLFFKLGYFLKNIPLSAVHAMQRPFKYPFPRVVHWSEKAAVPLLWVYSVLNTIPELSAVTSELVKNKTIYTLLGVPLALAQRVGEQRALLGSLIHKYYMYLAKKGDSRESSKQRTELVNALLGAQERVRELALPDLNTFYSVIFSRDQCNTATEHGVLVLLVGLNGTAKKSMDMDYKESTARRGTKVLAGFVGATGSIASSMIIRLTINSALVFLGVPEENSSVVSSALSTCVGLLRTVGNINNTRTYFLRIYDSYTGHSHYRLSGETNPNRSDVVYGKKEYVALVGNLLNASYWSCIYLPLGITALHNYGMPVWGISLLLVPTIVAQGVFVGSNDMDNISYAAHNLQRLRTRGVWTKFLDFLCCCVRGKNKCTRKERLKGADRDELKKAIRSFKLLGVLQVFQKAVETAPPEFIKSLHDLYVIKNPLLINSENDEENKEHQVNREAHTIPLINSRRRISFRGHEVDNGDSIIQNSWSDCFWNFWKRLKNIGYK
jgi:hypothetical protein